MMIRYGDKSRIAAILSLPLLFVALAALSVRAQEGEHGPVSTRGDKHSDGWAKAMKLKGAPLPPKFPKIGTDIERTVLDNGMVVYLMEDHRLPLVNATMLVRAGTYYDSPAELRLSSLGADLMHTGGSKNYSPEQLEERLDFIAANFGVSMQAEQCTVSLDVPQKDMDEGLRIFADVVRNPTFDQARLDLAKNQAQFALRRSNDSPDSILQREFRRLMYTDAHPAGRYPTMQRIAQISRDDLVKWHEKYFHPNQIMIGVIGDFKKSEMLEKIKKLFGDWPKQEVALSPLPKVDPTPKPGVYYVQKQVTQSSFWLAHWGVNRENPDRFAIDLMNDILGGSELNSRIGQRVRTDEGLAYSVGTVFNTDLRDINFFLAYGQTRSDATVKAIQSILDEVKKMRTEEISKNEFDSAKEMFLYSQVFKFAQPSQSLGALMNLEYEKLPPDYMEKEFAGYQAVTADDIERVAQKYLHPEQLTMFIVGDVAKFKQDLPQLGPVHEMTMFQFDTGGGNSARPPRQ